LTDETIEITEEQFYVKAFCAESHDNRIAFEIKFDFWEKVDSSKIKMERRPVGKINFVIPKAAKPARWR